MTNAPVNPHRLRAYLATRDAPCPRCGYNLRGNTAGICPECGDRVTLPLAPAMPAPARHVGHVLGGVGLSLGFCSAGFNTFGAFMFGSGRATLILLAITVIDLVALIAWVLLRRRILLVPRPALVLSCALCWVIPTAAAVYWIRFH